MWRGERLIIQLCIKGDKDVGKTSLRKRYAKPHRYAKGEFVSRNELAHSSRHPLDFKLFEINHVKCTVHIWDKEDPSKKEGMGITNNTHGGLICFDVTHKPSFDSIISWINIFDTFASCDIPICIIGCKSDKVLQRAVCEEEIEELMGILGNRFHYFETSSLTAFNVDIAFQFLIGHITDHFPECNTVTAVLGPTEQ